MPLFGLKKRAKAPAELIDAPVLRDLPPPTPPAEPEFVESPTADQLLQHLFDAISDGDADRLSTLCQTHRQSIDENAGAWRIVPDGLRANPAAAAWYVQGVERLTRYCAEISLP